MQKGSPREAGQIFIFLLVGILIIAAVGGAYYLGIHKSTSLVSSPAPSTSIDLCANDKDNILAVVTEFENLQQKRNAKGVLKLFTSPQSQTEIDDYNNLSSQDMHIDPRLYSNVSTNIKVISYSIVGQPTRSSNNSCSLTVEEERSYYGGPTNPQYLPSKKEEFNLILTKKDSIWLIDQYQSQNPQVRKGKYSGWLMEYSTSDETANWKTYTNTKYNFSIKYPNNWQPGWGTIGDGPTEEQMRQSNSLGWVRNNERSPFAIFSFRVIGPCSTTLDNCVKDFQTSNANGFDNQDQVQEKTKFLNKDSLTINHTRKQYGTSDLLIKKTFFTYEENLWLIETQIDNSTTQSVKNEIEKEINQILSTFKFL